MKRSNWLLTLSLFLVMGALLVGGAYFTRTSLGDNKSALEVRNVVDTPGQFYNKNVSLNGEIQNVIGTRAFTIDSKGGMPYELLVISKESLEPIGGSGYEQTVVHEDDTVEVNGVVREFKIQEIESLLGVDLLDERFYEWEGKPVVIAEEVKNK